jgi:hypothetical protein
MMSVVEFGVTNVRSIRGPMVCQAGTRFELAIDDMPRDVVRDAGDVERPHIVGCGGLEDDVRLIQIECPALAPHHQFGIDEEVDPASPIRDEIEVGSIPLDERKPGVAGLHPSHSY